MILMVAERLKLSSSEYRESEDCEEYWDVLLECVDQLLETQPNKMTYDTATLLFFTLDQNFSERKTNVSIWAKLDHILAENKYFHKELIRNKSALFKLILIYVRHFREMSREEKLDSSNTVFSEVCDVLFRSAIHTIKIKQEKGETKFVNLDSIVCFQLLPILSDQEDPEKEENASFIADLIYDSREDMNEMDVKCAVRTVKYLRA